MVRRKHLKEKTSREGLSMVELIPGIFSNVKDETWKPALLEVCMKYIHRCIPQKVESEIRMDTY